MHQHALHNWQHDHSFGTDAVTVGERRTRWVIALTLAMMVAEIIAGTVYCVPATRLA